MTKSHIPEWVNQELAKAEEAVARGKLELAAQPRATAARYDARKKTVVIDLANGASFAFPPSLGMRAHAARAGRARTPSKAAAARANGAKGGRPRNTAVVPA